MDLKVKHLNKATSLEKFDNNYLKVYRSDGLCTLLDAKTLNYAFGDKWFKDISDFFDDYYIVTRENGLKNLIKKSDGKFVNDTLWYDRWAIERFPSNCEDYLFIVFDKTKCTPLRKDLTFVCKDKWASLWSWFDGNLLMKRDDNLSTIVSIKDGSYMYDNKWFLTWQNFNSDYYLVKTRKGKKTLISKRDGSLAFKNLFAYEIYNFEDTFLVFKNKKYGSFLSSKDLKKVSSTKIEYQIDTIFQNIVLLKTYQSKTFANFSNKTMLAKYDRNTNKYSLISNDVFESVYTKVYKDFCRFKYISFKKVKDSTCTILRVNDAKIVLDSIIELKPYYECKSNSLYLVTREDGKKTVFDENTDSYVNKDAWFVDFAEVYDYPEVFLVTRENGLKSLVNQSDLSYVFDDIWFEKWDNAYPKYYLVYNKNKINFVNKTDGSLLFGKDSKKKENIIISYNWAINKFTIYVLEDKTLRVYKIT